MVGRTVQQYHFIEKLGAGGMGEIYKAQDTRLNRFVAIKVLTSDTAGDPERRRRFLQEAQAASALNHPNIITIHDIASDGDAQFMVMENVQGKTLTDLIPKGGLRVPHLLKICVQMADALAAAHNAGIIHRDLKPGNVMVTESGLVKVLDFGLAKLTDRTPFGGTSNDDATRTMADAPLTVEGAIIGTVSYMSPEQAQGRKIDPRSDIFSLGLVIYEMSTGVRAFHGDSALSTLSAILRDDPRPVHEIAPDVPPELEQVIARCLNKNPDDRWQTMTDLQRALSALKHESDSGVLYRSRLSSTSVPLNPSSGLPSGSGVRSQIVTGQRPGGASQASMGWSQAPSAPPLPPPGSQPQSVSQHAMPQPLVQPGNVQPGNVQPGNVPPGNVQPGVLPPGGVVPPKKSSTGLILGIAGGVLALGAIGGGAWFMTHRAAEPLAEAPKVTPPPVAVAKEEPPAVVPDPVAAAKAPEVSKAPDAKGKDAKQTFPAPVVTATKGAPPTRGAPPATSPVASAAKETPAAVPVVETPKPVAPPPVVARNTLSVTVPDAKPFMIRLSADVPNDADEGTALWFTVRDDVKVGELLVLAKGAVVTGQIVNGGKKRIIGSTKMTLRLIDAETNGGGKLRLRSLPGKRADGNYERPVDTGVKKSKDVAAPAGTEYVAYVDSEQTLNVRK